MSAAPMFRKGGQRGVSLVEALVAMAVMAIGMLGVVGMQATLRTNADVSRQRSEAVRMTQEKVEQLRAFAQLDSAPSGELDYADIVSSAAADVSPSSGRASATFKRTVTVYSPATSAAPMKTVQVQVQWWDRRADATDATDTNIQSVTLTSAIAPNNPALGASLGLPTNRSVTQRPAGRNSAIPRGAVTVTDSSSTFSPPGGGGITWTFNNDSGLIYRVSNVTGSVNAVLLSGYIRFATGSSQPTSSQSENPPGSALGSVGIAVTLTAPALGGSDFAGQCFVGSADASGAVPYYCAVPIFGSAQSPQTFTWSGRSNLTGLSLASTGTDSTASLYRVCRYTPNPATDDYLTLDSGAAVSPSIPQDVRNRLHPLDYTSVAGPLTDQNFLVIRAGDGTTPFTCPTDDTSTPLVDGDTRRHQPVS